MFLMVKGAKGGLIKGEAQDDDHKGEIEVLQLVVGHAGAGRRSAAARATGKATVHELKIVKRIDSASTALMARAANERADPEGRADAAQGRQDASSSTSRSPSSRGASPRSTIEAGDESGSPESARAA